MDCQKVGELIYQIRREKSLTQKSLADLMNISDKTVSKWERGLGCPDVSLLPKLSKILGIDIAMILSGELESNEVIGGNMKKIKFYVCNECGNIVAIETSYIAGRENCESQDSAFIRACKQLCVVCGDPTEEEAFRGAFWKAFFVDKAIEPIILKTVATGPRSTREYNALKGMNATFLPKLAISALTTLNEM